MARENRQKPARKGGDFVAKSVVMSRDARISREVARIKRNLKNMPEDKRRLVQGLIERAAFLRIELEDLEADLNENGSIEAYQAGPDTPPITRIRAAAQHYDKMVRQYITACKQLADLAAAPAGKAGKSGSAENENLFQNLLERRLQRVK